MDKEKNQKQPQDASKKYWISFGSYALLAVAAVITSVVTFLIYDYTKEILKERLRARMIAITSTASLLFEAEDLERLRELGEDAVSTQLYRDTIDTLREIREANEDISYAYLFGKTNDPSTVVFIADADVLAFDPELNPDGGEEDFPGAEYDASDAPKLQKEAFIEPSAEDDVIEDEWGMLLTAYGPIYDSSGNANSTLGIDVDVSEYLDLINRTLIPFALLVALLIGILIFTTVSLVRVWGSRVDLLRELDRQKDELLGIVSHQLAQPIAALKWYLEMMLDGDVGKLTKEQEEYLSTMSASAANLADLSSMILDVSRFQLGRMQIDRTELDLNDFFKEILSNIEPKATESKVKLVKKVEKNLPVAMLDKRLTRMTIENLLTNAVKYTPEKGTVDLTVENRNGNLYVEVTDTGIGIPEKDQKKLFGKLFRASNTGSIDGNGFGLYVAKGAIEAQNGKIWFTSKENKGTSFFVELPLVEPEKNKKESKKK